MAQLTKSQFLALYGQPAGTTFPDNTTQEISESDARQLGQDIADSLLFRSDAILTVSITPTLSAIKALSSAGIQCVAAQGANTVIEVISAYYIHTYGTVQFDFTGNLHLSLGIGAGSLAISPSFSASTTLNQNANRTTWWYGPNLGVTTMATGSTSGINKALYLLILSGSDATVGDSTGKIIVNYRIVDLSV